nr:MAG TPA: protein of unknown function DUF4969 [Caudoviricetes sp.]
MKRIQIIIGVAALLAAMTACTSPKHGQPTTDTAPAQIVAVERVSADTDAVTGEDTRGECWTWYTDAGDYRSGDRVQLTFDGSAVIDATPAG